MSPFEYVIVLVSIIIGLGMALVLSGVAQLIREDQRVKFFLPYQIWIGLVFVLHIHEWWITYQLKSMIVWRLPTFLFIILYPILLFILANLLFPDSWQNHNRDMKQFYFTAYRRFFGCAILLVILSVLQNMILTGLTLADQVVQFIVLAVLLVIFIRRPANVLTHNAVAVLLLLLLVISSFLERDSLLIQ